MNCKNLKIRSRKYIKYFYCSLCKQEIDVQECRKCKFKEYKAIKKIKGKKHEQTKATEISKEVKLQVWERDMHKCVLCGKLVPWNLANAHFIPRGLGRFRNTSKYIYSL